MTVRDHNRKAPVGLTGAMIRYFRTARGKSIRDVALHTGLGERYLMQVEQGERYPSGLIQQAIANALGVDASAFVCADLFDNVAAVAGIEPAIASAIFEEIVNVAPEFTIDDVYNRRQLRQKVIDVFEHINWTQ